MAVHCRAKDTTQAKIQIALDGEPIANANF